MHPGARVELVATYPPAVPASEHGRAHDAAQLAEVELEPKRKQQQVNAELCNARYLRTCAFATAPRVHVFVVQVMSWTQRI